MKRRLTTEIFIERSKKVHENKYDYSLTEYNNSTTKVTVICPVHGEFSILPSNHLRGQGCPKCNGRNFSQEEVLKKFNEVHGEMYDYSKVVFRKMKEKVHIICSEHGEFLQTPQKHINGQGCPRCSAQTKAMKRKMTSESFIERANQVHHGKYMYRLLPMKNLHEKITIKCPMHGDFQQIAQDHLNGHGCPICGKQNSFAEEEINTFLLSLGEKTEIHTRNVIPPYELDIYIPNRKIAIEYNGLRWHSEHFKEDKDYHLTKTEMCETQDITLVQIFEDEWLYHTEAVKSFIKSALNKEILSNNFEVKSVDKEQARVFLEKYNIKGFQPSELFLGYFEKNVIRAVLGIELDWKCSINTFATDGLNQNVFEILFKHLITRNEIQYLDFVVDRRFPAICQILEANNFKLEETLPPSHSYVDENKNQRFDSQNESQTFGFNLYRIWDCGYLRYIWKR